MYIFPAANCFTNKKCRKSPKCFNGNIFNINWCFNFNAPWISIQWRSYITSSGAIYDYGKYRINSIFFYFLF